MRFFSATEPKIEQLQTSIKQITHKYRAYCDHAAALLAAFFNRSTLGHSPFHEVYNKVIVRAKKVELLDFTRNWCSRVQAVCLIVALGLCRMKYRHLLSFASAKQQASLNATGVRVPSLFPDRRTVEDTWKRLTNLCA